MEDWLIWKCLACRVEAVRIAIQVHHASKQTIFEVAVGSCSAAQGMTEYGLRVVIGVHLYLVFSMVETPGDVVV